MELKKLNCCGKIHFSELFPTRWSILIFIAYMVFFVNQGLLVTATQKSDKSYNYNITLAVLVTEVMKLLVSLFLYMKDRSILNLLVDMHVHSKVMVLYFVPAFLYCVYNNLAYVNLSAFDPTTYYLLLQFRVVITGVLFQMLFSKELSTKQWLSLIMLTAGCMIKQLPFADSSPATTVQQGNQSFVLIQPVDKGDTPLLGWNMVLILVQVVCSCLAGVYNELLLKSSKTEVCNIYIQNIFMYINSIVLNMGVLAWQGNLFKLLDDEELNKISVPMVALVIFNNAAIGIVTSFFLRSLNSILKTFASALELIFTAFLTWLFFDIPIYLNTFCAIFVVSLAVVMYSQNPVTVGRPVTLKELPFKEVSPV